MRAAGSGFPQGPWASHTEMALEGSSPRTQHTCGCVQVSVAPGPRRGQLVLLCISQRESLLRRVCVLFGTKEKNIKEKSCYWKTLI